MLTLTLLILCAAAANAAMQFPRLEMLLLILFASSSRTPSNPDLHTRSEPARSTMDRTERLTLVVEEEEAEVVLPANDGVR